jgi:hypothetical protein
MIAAPALAAASVKTADAWAKSNPPGAAESASVRGLPVVCLIVCLGPDKAQCSLVTLIRSRSPMRH